jgi:serine/threonine-protein kinase RsbT
MSRLEDQVLGVLETRVSTLTARSLLRRALDHCALDALAEHDLPRVLSAIEGGVRLFVSEDDLQDVLDRLGNLGGRDVAPIHERIAVAGESDVTRARMTTRAVAGRMGADTFVAQKILTAVSELARNIAQYAGRGEVDLTGEKAPRRRLRIIAADEGPGIADVEWILSGKYKSRTGLGRGLLGVRRMADGFDIDSSPRGTTVTVEFVL